MKGMRRRLGWKLVLLVALGCASDDPRVGTAFDPLYAFPPEATLAWSDRDNVLPDDPRIARMDLEPIIKQVAGEELAARGYRLVEADPDYWLSYQVRIDWFKVATSEMLGSLSLELVERASRSRVWTGFGRSSVSASRTPEEREARMRQAVRKMLEDFPPGVR